MSRKEEGAENSASHGVIKTPGGVFSNLKGVVARPAGLEPATYGLEEAPSNPEKCGC